MTDDAHGRGERQEALLFSCGALQHPPAQLDLFGRCPTTERAVVAGHAADYAHAVDDEPALRATGDARSRVVGSVLHLDPDELDAADEHTTGRRAAVRLRDGRVVWARLADP